MFEFDRGLEGDVLLFVSGLTEFTDLKTNVPFVVRAELRAANWKHGKGILYISMCKYYIHKIPFI